MLTVTGFESQEDYDLDRPFVFHFELDDDGESKDADDKHSELENQDWFLVTTTDNDGKLKR
ncbi:hypothetical protein ACQKQC_05335 [Vibrio fortis]|uniref:hypothetical protein n=1 Tax=Vibrio fortis TaxID=212667 RepID=UPI004068CC55